MLIGREILPGSGMYDARRADLVYFRKFRGSLKPPTGIWIWGVTSLVGRLAVALILRDLAVFLLDLVSLTPPRNRGILLIGIFGRSKLGV